MGLPWPGTICHGTSRSSPSMVPEPYEGPYGPPERLVFLFGWVNLLLSRIPFLKRTAGYAIQHAEELGNGRKTRMVSECLTMAPFFLNGVEERWGSGFLTRGSCRILASWT